jgi:hypothetical protein
VKLESLTLLVGKSFTGKTARMLHELRDEPRVILVDPKCAQLVNLRGWVHLWPDYDEESEMWKDRVLLDYFLQLSNPPDGTVRSPYRVPFRCVVHFKHHHRDCLDLLCRMVDAVQNCVLAVDELALFCPPGSSWSLPQNVTSVAVSGTHKGIRVMGTVQRPTLVHRTIRANASRILFYRVTEGEEIDAVLKYMPRDWQTSPETLPDYVCIDWRDGKIPFVDSSLVGRLNTLPGRRSKYLSSEK